MNADTQLVDYKGNIINPGDKVLIACGGKNLVERIYLGRTDKSFMFSKYSFFKDPNRETIEVPAYWDTSRVITKRVNKELFIQEHNTVVYERKRYFNPQGIFLLERDSKDINPDLVRYVRKEDGFNT